MQIRQCIGAKFRTKCIGPMYRHRGRKKVLEKCIGKCIGKMYRKKSRIYENKYEQNSTYLLLLYTWEFPLRDHQ